MSQNEDVISTTQPSKMWSSVRRLMIASWAATKGDRPRVITFIILCILKETVDILVPFATGWTLKIYVERGFTDEAFNMALWGVGAFVGLRVLLAILHHVACYLQGTAGFNARFTKLDEVFSSLIAFPLRWHVVHHSGESNSRLHRSVGAVEQVIRTYMWQFVEILYRLVVPSVLIFMFDYKVGAAALAMGLITVLIMLLFNARLARNLRKNNRYYDRQNRTVLDYLSNIITVKTLHLEDSAVSYLGAQRPEGVRICSQICLYQELKWGTVGFGYTLVMGTALLMYFYDRTGVNAAAFDVTLVYVLLNYLDRIFGAINSFTGVYSGVIEAAIAHDDASSVIIESAALRVPRKPSRLPSDWENFSLRDITFSYTGTASNLNVTDLTISRGEKIALVGPSGGGKSTLLKVLGGMLQVAEGRVITNSDLSLDVDDVSSASLLIPQEPEIFSETVRYNLSLGETFPQAELQRAVETCRIDHILAKLPKGWDSDLEEAGLNLSVGERQRLALARGILRVPGKDLLLLDEPTSSLDPLTEKQIFHGILSQFADRTIITACHRLALVPLFDRIIYIRDGRVEEAGSFPELRAAGKAFAAAWSDYERNVSGGEVANG